MGLPFRNEGLRSPPTFSELSRSFFSALLTGFPSQEFTSTPHKNSRSHAYGRTRPGGLPPRLLLVPASPQPRGCGAPPGRPPPGSAAPAPQACAHVLEHSTSSWQISCVPGGTSEHGACGGQERISLENVCPPVCQRIPPVLTDSGRRGTNGEGNAQALFPSPADPPRAA